VRPPQRPENSACCVWKHVAVKQPSVRSLPLKNKRFIPPVKKTAQFQPLVRARPKNAP
jgi:hypothetical protein